jgi:glucose/arabinose dehydrogenase
VTQPYTNHNGGNLVFGPDGMLWIGLGDGGNGGDPQNHAQNLDPNDLLGKMLRIDPLHGSPYAIPSGNLSGAIWAYGLRNPWRYSFDRGTGDLWIGDVGQNAWEEIDFHPVAQGAGANYGWARYEGTHIYDASRSAPNAIGPVYEYGHTGGNCSVTGGYVYRGTRIANLGGGYLFGDYCAGRVIAFYSGQVRDLGLPVSGLSSFGQDLSGELYALSLNGGVYRIDPA